MRKLLSTLLFSVLAIGAFAVSTPAVAAGAKPDRIVSLSPTATEMLFAIGAGPQVIAVDDRSSFPKRAPRTDLSGFEPNVEAIAGYTPDLVVVDSDTTKASLEALGINVVVQPSADKLSDSYDEIRELGKVTGHASGARRVVAEMKADIADLASKVPKGGKAPTAYYELDDTFFSADSSTFIGRLLKLGGFANIADKASDSGSGFPQLSSEYVVDANPDVFFLADTKCCGQNAQTVAKRPGFENLKAVKGDAIVPLDDDVASRWGPRVVELLRLIVKERKQL